MGIFKSGKVKKKTIGHGSFHPGTSKSERHKKEEKKKKKNRKEKTNIIMDPREVNTSLPRMVHPTPSGLAFHTAYLQDTRRTKTSQPTPLFIDLPSCLFIWSFFCTSFLDHLDPSHFVFSLCPSSSRPGPSCPSPVLIFSCLCDLMWSWGKYRGCRSGFPLNFQNSSLRVNDPVVLVFLFLSSL